MEFECSKCGFCCKRVGLIIPELNRGDGVCRKLSEDNLCTIYEERPLICNIGALYEKCFSNMVTREEFFSFTHKCCKALQEDN
jgi:Fe-S-cluster containining protein